MSMESSKHHQQHAALLCSPGMGHLIPLLELGKRLILHQNFIVTIFVVPSNTSKAETELLKADSVLEIIKLPPPDISNFVDPDASVFTRIAAMMREVRPAFRSALHDMKLHPTMLIVDFFGTESLPIAKELGIPKYVYIATNAWFLSLMVYSPTLGEKMKGEFVEEKEPLKIPGCRSIHPQIDILDSMEERNSQQYNDQLEIARRLLKGSDGVLLNIWEELEPKTLASLRDEKLLGRVMKVPVYPIGPLIRPKYNVSLGPNGKMLFDWLDKQPNDSVIYVSFGSGGTISYEQMTELAWGLELSQQRFVWVIRSPIVSTAEAYLASGNNNDDGNNPLKYLPDGFLDRTKGIGLVILVWAPQVDILAHRSIGGFLSHCGWSSTLESIANGVSMIAWPLYAEQRMNATLLVEELGVAVRSKIPPWVKVVEREEIEVMIRKIIKENEGFALRDRVQKLKLSGLEALRKGGSSYNALSQFAKLK